MENEKGLERTPVFERQKPDEVPEISEPHEPHDDVQHAEKNSDALNKERTMISNELNKVRDEIGLPQQQEEVPPSIKALDEKISVIDDGSREKPIDAKVERQKYSKFLDSAKSVMNILGKRDSERLSPLLDESNLSRMRSALRNIDDLFSQNTFDETELFGEIDKINSAIEALGDAKRGGKEDLGSLTVVITKLKGLGADCSDLIGILFKSSPKEKIEVVVKSLDRLTQSCDTKSKAIIRIREAFANYTRR